MSDLDLDALLAAERARPDPPAAAKAEVAAHLATLGAPGGAAPDAAPPTAPPTAPSPPGAGVSTAIGAKLAAAALVGAIVGGGAVAAVMPPKIVERTVTERVVVSATAPPATVTTPSAPPIVTASPAEPSARPRTTATTAATTSATTAHANVESDLARERALVDRARAAMARGDSKGALAAAAEHEKSFPKGQLEEEREVVAIQALAAAGRAEEAANRAASFRKSHPSSLLLPVVDAALRPPP